MALVVLITQRNFDHIFMTDGYTSADAFKNIIKKRKTNVFRTEPTVSVCPVPAPESRTKKNAIYKP